MTNLKSKMTNCADKQKPELVKYFGPRAGLDSYRSKIYLLRYHLACSPLQPAMDGIPGDSLYPNYRGLVQALDAERGNLIEDGATMLEPMVWRAGVRAERLTARTATISTTPPAVGSVESVADDA
jgi:hypothetical protein